VNSAAGIPEHHQGEQMNAFNKPSPMLKGKSDAKLKD
jgi:hypothetical protein